MTSPSPYLTPVTPPGWSPDVAVLPAETLLPDALLITATTKVAQIEGDAPYVRIPKLDLSGDVAHIPEGNTFDEAEAEAEEVLLKTAKIGVLVRISREQLAQPLVPDVVRDAIERAVRVKADTVTVNGGAGMPQGIADQAIAAGSITNNLDPVVDACALIESGWGTPSHVVCSPSAWASVSRLKKESSSNESLIGAGTAPAPRSLLGLPVLVNAALPDGHLLVLDRRQVLSAYGEVLTAVSNDVYFASDEIGIRASWRFGVGMLKETAAVDLTIETVEAETGT
jgi:HK97 family phage major capsid protein